MKTINDSTKSASEPTRRQILLGTAIGIGTLATASSALAALRPSGAELQGTIDKKLRTSLHQEIEIAAEPHRIYEALMDSKQFAAVTGLSATIHREEGGTFATFGGVIIGRNVELVKDTRIVQAWKPKYWDPGVYSLVKFELKPHGTGTTLILDHTGFPEGDFESLDSGWYQRYWTPLKKYLG